MTEEAKSRRGSLTNSKVFILKDDDLEKLSPSVPTRRRSSMISKETIINFLEKGRSLSEHEEPVNIPIQFSRKVTFILDGIDKKILSCNPILESFGNAKTIRNDNSSRFGKLVLLLVDPMISQVKGAFITNFLLEKSRVISQAKGERNYHIFYQILTGASEELKNDLLLGQAAQYEYLNKSGCYSINNIDDKKEFNEIENSFKV